MKLIGGNGVINSFGDYRIIKEIGHGSSARVYSAQRNNEPIIALKIFDIGKNSLHAKAVRQFFEREVSQITTLTHKGVIKYIDAGVINDTPYIAMELLSEGSLESRIQMSILDIDNVVFILDQIANALDYVHERNVLHRDIKPANILFRADGTPVLTDFGIAHVFTSRDVVATPIVGHGYMTMGSSDVTSPEVLLEAPSTKASDIYSLGMTVYFALSGKFPTDGLTLYTQFRKRVEDKLIPLTERNPTISLSTSQVVMKALARDPKDRYETACEFAAALRISISKSLNTPIENKNSILNRKEKIKPIEYWRYIIVPLCVGVFGVIATWLSNKH